MHFYDTHNLKYKDRYGRELKYDNRFSRWLADSWLDRFLEKVGSKITQWWYGVDVMIAMIIGIPGIIIGTPDEWLRDHRIVTAIRPESFFSNDWIGYALVGIAVMIMVPRDIDKSPINGYWTLVHDLLAILGSMLMGYLSGTAIYDAYRAGIVPYITPGLFAASLAAMIFTSLRFMRKPRQN